MGAMKQMIFEVAESKFPGNLDAQNEYFRKCIEGKIPFKRVFKEWEKIYPQLLAKGIRKKTTLPKQ
jgi:hypothetical protein